MKKERRARTHNVEQFLKAFLPVLELSDAGAAAVGRQLGLDNEACS